MALPIPHLDGVEHRDVSVRGLRLHVALAGPEDGRPVVLQHGWPQHWFEWRELIGPLAAAGHRVIVPDIRGFGWSEHSPDEDFLKETLVADLVGVCAELGHERISFVGHDWGCWIGWLLCLGHPELVERAFLISVPPPFPPERMGDPAALKRIPKLWYQVVIGTPLPRAAKVAFFRAILEQGRNGAWAPGLVDTYLAPLSQPAQIRASMLLYRQFLTREFSEIVGGRYAGQRLTMPVRFLVGRDDPLFYEDVVEQAAPHADDYAGEALDGVAHFVPEEAPDVVRQRVLDFLA